MNLDAIQMQFRCNLDATQILDEMQMYKDVIQMQCLVLYSYLTFRDLDVPRWNLDETEMQLRCDLVAAWMELGCNLDSIQINIEAIQM